MVRTIDQCSRRFRVHLLLLVGYLGFLLLVLIMPVVFSPLNLPFLHLLGTPPPTPTPTSNYEMARLKKPCGGGVNGPDLSWERRVRGWWGPRCLHSDTDAVCRVRVTLNLITCCRATWRLEWGRLVTPDYLLVYLLVERPQCCLTCWAHLP